MTDLIEFDEDATRLKWQRRDHRDGETAQFAVCGLHVWVQDLDGDYCIWEISKGRRGPIIAKGDTIYFPEALRDAEHALYRIISERIAQLRAAASSAQPLPLPGKA